VTLFFTSDRGKTEKWRSQKSSGNVQKRVEKDTNTLE